MASATLELLRVAGASAEERRSWRRCLLRGLDLDGPPTAHGQQQMDNSAAVSYTHLTLPTICSV
eukprot:13671226-Alexandrium_andersonii.AAC.1